MNGYKELRPVGIKAPAEMLETWAGYDEGDVDRELAFAIGCVDADDPDTLRWLACGIERRLDDLDLAARTCPDCGGATMALYDDGSKLCGRCVVARHFG